MDNSSQIRIGTILSYVNLAIGCVIPVFYTPIMLELLGQDEYGLYSLANSVVGYLALLNFGLGVSISRYMTRERALGKIENVRRLMGLFITIYLCLSALVLIAGCILVGCSGAIFAKGLTAAEIGKLQMLLVIMTVSIAISFPSSVYYCVVVSYERYVFNKTVSIIETLLSPVQNLIILFMGFGSVGIAMTGPLMHIVTFALYAIYCYKKLNIYPEFRHMPTDILKELLIFCAFVFLSSITDMLYWATDKVLIGALLGATAVAVYNIGGTFSAILQNMAHAISNVFSSRVNIMVAKGVPKQEVSDLMIRVGRLQFLIISLILSGYVVFGQDFIRLWAGEEYADAYFIALLTMSPLCIPLIQNVAFTATMAENKHRFRSIMYFSIAIINVISTWLVLPYFGIIGAAACTSVAFIVGNGIILNIYYYKVIKLDIPKFWANILQMSIVPGCMIAVALLLLRTVLPTLTLTMFIGGVVIYTAVFCLLSWLISMNRYEKSLIASMFAKFLPKKHS